MRSADDTNWQDRAACGIDDAHAFYPEDIQDASDGLAALLKEDAVSICGTCPVASECLAYALANGEQFGIWGGLDPEERDKLLNLGHLRVIA